MKRKEFYYPIILLGIFLLLMLLCACNSKRTAVTETETVGNLTVMADTTHAEYCVKESAVSEGHVSGSVETKVSDTGRISINRDSAGRVTGVEWERSGNASSHGSASGGSVSGTETSGSSGTAARSRASQSSRKEKTREEKQTETQPIPWECRIGWTLVGLGLIYVIYVIIKDYLPEWIRKR